MTDKDRTELREKIAKTLEPICRERAMTFAYKVNEIEVIMKEQTNNLTDQILALFAQEAEAIRLEWFRAGVEQGKVEERVLLEKAIELIKIWHNGEAVMKLGQEKADYMWKIYYNNAPEMKEIREALKSKEK